MTEITLADRLTQARKAKGFSSREKAAEAFGWSVDTYSSHEGGRRNPNRSTLRRYASAYEVTISWLLTGEGEGPTNANVVSLPLKTKTKATQLPIVGAVQGGAFMEAWPAMQEPYETLPVTPDSKYEGRRQYLLKVQGPSVNEFFPDGSYAHCVEMSYRTGSRMPDPGTFVIVERRKAGLVEVTIKELRQTPEGRYELWPRSNDPAWQTPITIDDDASVDEIAITGIAIGAYRKF